MISNNNQFVFTKLGLAAVAIFSLTACEQEESNTQSSGNSDQSQVNTQTAPSTGPSKGGYNYGVNLSSKKDPSKPFKGESYSPYAKRNFPNEPLWGDTHLHTNLSLDARAAGVLLSPRDAYRFARGDEVTSSHGERVRLSRPLDFVTVTDHSDAIGVMNEIIKGNDKLMVDATLKDWHNRISKGGEGALMAGMEVVKTFTQGKMPDAAMSESFARTIWDDYFDAAEEFNEPGKFTAMIAYEWTSSPDGNNLHRNVFYRDGADKAKQVLPYTVADSVDPEDLWAWMERYEKKTGGKILAAAHNGNLSNGLMFPLTDYQGNPMTKAYAEKRQKWEPLYEATQIKGDGETHPQLSTQDEFADYGTWDKGNLAAGVKTPEMIPFEYAREALKNGLLMESKLGANPFQIWYDRRNRLTYRFGHC